LIPWRKTLAEPGEAVGVIAAQSMGASAKVDSRWDYIWLVIWVDMVDHVVDHVVDYVVDYVVDWLIYDIYAKLCWFLVELWLNYVDLLLIYDDL